RQELTIALPSAERAIELAPLLRIEARIGEFAQAQRAGRGAEPQIARALTHVARSVRLGRIDHERRVLEIAGGIFIALAADELQKLVVALAVLKAVGLIERARRTIRIPGNAAVGIGRDA